MNTTFPLNFQTFKSKFSPDHLIHNTGIGLNDFYHLCGYVFLDIVGNGDAVIAVITHIDRRCNCLQKAVFINSREDKASLIKCFGAFGACPYANRRERMSDAREERTFLR